MKLSYERHRRKAAARKWPRDPVFADYKAVTMPDGGVLVECRHPACDPKRLDGTSSFTPRPRLRADSLREAREWVQQHSAEKHAGRIA